MESVINDKYFQSTMKLQKIMNINSIKTLKILETPSYCRMINNINELSNALKSPLLECIEMQNRLSSLYKIPSITIPKVGSNIYKLINIDQRLFRQNIDAITRWTDLTNTWTNTYNRIFNINKFIQYPNYESYFLNPIIESLEKAECGDIKLEDIDRDDINESISELTAITEEVDIADELNFQQRIIAFIEKWKEKNPLIFKFIAFLLATVCAFGVTVTGTLISNTLIHEEPSRESQVIIQLKEDQLINIIDEVPYYYQIEVTIDNDNVIGWVSKRSVQKTSD